MSTKNTIRDGGALGDVVLVAALAEDRYQLRDAATWSRLAADDLKRWIRFKRTGDYYGTRGGGIGQAMPGAIGAKLAHPDRPVIAISVAYSNSLGFSLRRKYSLPSILILGRPCSSFCRNSSAADSHCPLRWSNS